MNRQLERRTRKSAAACWLLSAAAIVALAPRGLAQPAPQGQASLQNQSLTWPPVEASVTIRNGVVVAEGRTVGPRQQVVWTVPLVADNHHSITSRTGWGMLFVSVGKREFVVNMATGAAAELRPGAVWQYGTRLGPPALPEGQPPSYPPGPATQPTTAPAATTGPTAEQIQARQQVLRRAMIANQMLLNALGRLQRIQELVAGNRIRPEDLAMARQAVQSARHDANQASQDLATLYGQAVPAPTAAPRGPAVEKFPLSKQDRQQIAQAQQKVVNLAVRQDQSLAQYEQMQVASHGEGGPTKDQLAAARAAGLAVAGQLRQARRQLDEVRMKIEDRAAIAAAPHLQQAIAQAQKKVEDLQAAADKLEGQIHQNRKPAPAPVNMQGPEARLLETMKQLDQANSQLETLQDQAFAKPAPAKTAATPKPTKAAPAKPAPTKAAPVKAPPAKKK